MYITGGGRTPNIGSSRTRCTILGSTVIGQRLFTSYGNREAAHCCGFPVLRLYTSPTTRRPFDEPGHGGRRWRPDNISGGCTRAEHHGCKPFDVRYSRGALFCHILIARCPVPPRPSRKTRRKSRTRPTQNTTIPSVATQFRVTTLARSPFRRLI